MRCDAIACYNIHSRHIIIIIIIMEPIERIELVIQPVIERIKPHIIG